MLRVPYNDLLTALETAACIISDLKASAPLSEHRLFAETTRDGVYTHGLDRFPRFAEMSPTAASTSTPNPRASSAGRQRSSAGTGISASAISTRTSP